MAEYRDREHFVPLRVPDLLDLLCDDRGPSGDSPLPHPEQELFRRFADVAASHVHAGYLQQLHRLKIAYAPFDPDADTLDLRELTEDEQTAARKDLICDLVHLMERANYTHLTRKELEEVMDGASDWGVDMSVDWSCFEALEVFIRGKGFGKRIRRKWYHFFRRETVQLPTFQRVVIVLKQAPNPRMSSDTDTENVFLKLFKDIPQIDVEMLLPGTRVKMPLLDRFKLGGTMLSSVGYVLWKLSAVSIAAITGAVAGSAGLLGLLTLYTPLALIAGYGYKTYASFQTTKQTYMLQLHQSLYYQNLDNNAGVLYRMMDEAEEQELREVLLGYFYLWRYAGPEGWGRTELDEYIELDLERRLSLKVDFEIEDSLDKLLRAGIVTRIENRFAAVPLAECLKQLKLLSVGTAHVSDRAGELTDVETAGAIPISTIPE